MKRNLAIIIVLALLAFPSLSTADTRYDGNFWRNTVGAAGGKYAFVSGFYSGVFLGRDFSTRGVGVDLPCFGKAWDSFAEYEKYMHGVTAGQTSDGLDSFYSDYRNRKIRMTDAVWVVLKSISGTPQAEIDKLTEKYRSIDK